MCAYDCGFSSLALFGSVGPINDLHPSTAFSRDSTINNVGPLLTKPSRTTLNKNNVGQLLT